MWLDGHGERRLTGAANHDFGEFGRQLQQKGFKTSSVNLGVAQEVPANAALLLIASPQVDLLRRKWRKSAATWRNGGNLLWLIDPEPLRGLQPVAELLGLVLTPGTVIDPALTPRSGPPVYALGAAAGYGRHPITITLNLNTLFPFARQIGTVESETWRSIPLVQVAQRGWVEVGSWKAISPSTRTEISRARQYRHRFRAHDRRPAAARGSDLATPVFFRIPFSVTAAIWISA
jgi:hypothetical protein